MDTFFLDPFVLRSCPFIFLFSAPFYSEAQITLRSLSDFSTKRISEKPSSPQVYVLFQNECSSCKKQIKDLACLRGKSPVSLIGVFSPENDLRLEYRMLKTSLPAFYGDQSFREAFKVDPMVSPQVLVLGRHKTFLNLGYTPCEQILAQTKKALTSGAQKESMSPQN